MAFVATLTGVIMEYLAITPHSHKFMFHQISEVLETSINTCSDFSAYSAACAFDALAQYAANLITQPWRREFRQIKVSQEVVQLVVQPSCVGLWPPLTHGYDRNI